MKKFTLVAAAALAVVAGGCGSSSKTAAPPSASTGSPAKVVLGTASSSFGTILTAGGRTVYELSADTPTASHCTGACVAIWPPVEGSAQAGAGVNGSMVGHLSRPGGATQVSYGGHPLYTFSGDTGPGQTHGEGIRNFGGTWDVVSSSTGQPVAASGSSATTAPSKSYSGGY